jgi:hypothetical protein
MNHIIDLSVKKSIRFVNDGVSLKVRVTVKDEADASKKFTVERTMAQFIELENRLLFY